MTKINRTKIYAEFVISQVCEEIAGSTGCSKEDAQTLLINALAYNTVLAEVVDKAKQLAPALGAEVAA